MTWENGVCVEVGSLGEGGEGKRGKKDGENCWHLPQNSSWHADWIEMMLWVPGDVNQYNWLQHSADMCDVGCVPLSDELRMLELRFGFLRVVCFHVKTSFCGNKV